MLLNFLLLACSAFGNQDAAADGTIAGVVVNAADNRPVANAEVVLRMEVGGQLVPIAETTADDRGKFLFAHLPAGRTYLPGANRDGVHYPGQQVRLTLARREVNVTLSVCDGVTQPNPLVAEQHEIDIQPQVGALRVTESLRINNPTSTCYVGHSSEEGSGPITLQLSIPTDFVRATFDEEFYGRRFSLVDGKLVTGIPWPPGRRTIKFTYVLPNSASQRLWQRRLDLPCAQLRVTIHTDKPEEVRCDLGPARVEPGGQVTFQSTGRDLPAGRVIHVELGHLPVPFMLYARWAALLGLVGLIAAGIISARRRQRRRAPPLNACSASARANQAPAPHVFGAQGQRQRKAAKH